MSNVLADVQALQDQVVAMTSGSSFAPIAPTTTDAQSDVSDVSDACTFEGGNAFECPTSFQDGSMQFTSVATIDVPIQEDWQSDMSFAATAIDTMCSVANDLGNNTDSSLECDEIFSTVSIVDYATMSKLRDTNDLTMISCCSADIPHNGQAKTRVSSFVGLARSESKSRLSFTVPPRWPILCHHTGRKCSVFCVQVFWTLPSMVSAQRRPSLWTILREV